MAVEILPVICVSHLPGSHPSPIGKPLFSGSYPSFQDSYIIA